MVYCCVPRCPSGKRIDLNVSFHSFPSNPDMAARWIRNINLFIPNGGTWFPKPGDLVCSNHFLSTDYKPEMVTPSLRARSVPTVFENSVSFEPTIESASLKRKRDVPKSPLIVKVIKPVVEEDYDSEMDDAPLTELLRDKSSSVSTSSTDVASPSKKNSSCFITHVTRTTESQKHSPNTSFSQNRLFSDVDDSNVTAQKDSDHCQNVAGPKDYSSNQESEKYRGTSTFKRPKILTKSYHKRDVSSDLIEIGPGTFLKINPEVITVTKKVTQSGNTVLQFVMNPSLGVDAKNIFQTVTNAQIPSTSRANENDIAGAKNPAFNDLISNDADFTAPDSFHKDNLQGGVSGITPFTPAILSTNLPIHSSFGVTWKQRHASALRQKNRQIHSLNAKLGTLLKRVDELETKCIVQERQLDFPSLKKLRTIKKNAEKGEPHACFILEQIRGYSGNIPLRWSESTMTQCSIWCRKAPYAYEYFKKADLFRLPCVGTVKRYMKKHPEITMQIKNRSIGVHVVDSDSSSDFDFDEDSDDDLLDEDSNENVNNNNQVPCEVLLNENDSFPNEDSETLNMIVPDVVPLKQNETNFASSEVSSNFSLSTMPLPSSVNDSLHKTDSTDSSGNTKQATVVNKGNEDIADPTQIVEEHSESKLPADVDNMNGITSSSDNVIVKTISDSEMKSIYLPNTTQEGRITTMNFNGQEIILQPANIIQLNSDLSSADGLENQFFVIPSADDQSPGDRHYSVAQPVSFVIQNGDNDEQVIYITEDANDVPEDIAVSLADSNL